MFFLCTIGSAKERSFATLSSRMVRIIAKFSSLYPTHQLYLVHFEVRPIRDMPMKPLRCSSRLDASLIFPE